MAVAVPKGRAQLRAELVGAAAVRARIPTTASAASRPRRAGAKLRVRGGDLRRPLQPGAAVLPQPDRRSSRPTSRDAFVFELSKVETPGDPRAHGRPPANVDEELAATVAERPRLEEIPDAGRCRPGRRRTDLPPSPALSILLNGPDSFEGRKLGVLVTDGVDAAAARRRSKARSAAEGAMLEFVAPMVGGVKASDGTWIDRPTSRSTARRRSSSTRSRCCCRADGAALLAERGDRARLRRRRLRPREVHRLQRRRRAVAGQGRRGTRIDGGFFAVEAERRCDAFVAACRKVRFWEREAKVHA